MAPLVGYLFSNAHAQTQRGVQDRAGALYFILTTQARRCDAHPCRSFFCSSFVGSAMRARSLASGATCPNASSRFPPASDDAASFRTFHHGHAGPWRRVSQRFTTTPFVENEGANARGDFAVGGEWCGKLNV
eukprot:6201346-Pleurochrysis_carterae.AAC.1